MTENTELEKLLIETPKLISALSRKMLVFSQQIEALNSDITRIERQHMLSIIAQKDENNKPLYSNEQARNSALSNALKDDNMHITLSASMTSIKSEMEQVKIGLQEQVNLFGAYKAIANLRSG